MIKINPKMLYDKYIEINRNLPGVLVYTKERQRKCQSRCDEFNKSANPQEAFSDWCKAIEKAQSTPFLCGAGNRGWKANFDWFIANGTNYLTVLEGYYDGEGTEIENIVNNLK